MKIGARLLFSLYVGFIAASLVYFLYSPTGLLEYRRLQSELVRLESNLQELKELHRELSGEFESLRRSPETVILRARDLGYAQSGETFVMVDDLNLSPGNYYSVGRIIAPRVDSPARTTVSFITGLVTMLAAFLLMAIFTNPQRRAGRSAHNHV